MHAVIDVTVPLVDTTTGLPYTVLSMPCFCDANGVRHFFGPLLVRASRMQRAQSVYRKIRNVAARRVASDSEMAFVRRHHPQLYKCIMRERRLQIDEAAHRHTRKRARRRRALEKTHSVPSGDRVAADPILSNSKEDDDSDAHSYASSTLVICDSDDETLETGAVGRSVSHANNANNDNSGTEAMQMVEDNDCEEDDGGDADYDADGAGDLIPAVPRRQPAARGPCAVTASTIYLVEATSRLIEFLGTGFVLPDIVHEPLPATAPDSCCRMRDRTWPQIEPAIASWAAARSAAFDATLGGHSHKSPRRRRKQNHPVRALLPMP
ncbi:hypothetical protein pmac_cds_766 [Pandoravirus macleodensis]|uniref:Uncharacterized protein n=1 Tax=Pandoravirus macleodensis TaxID=2107707 RepID=A0A2U7UG61_9VIRU|nr:hypothetical protein pmac_cds_766 [Pandoravirus macleodensis]AVK77454.1 hypothetical protein pmac_cds_766 [Pandoravirus macleodensis]